MTGWARRPGMRVALAVVAAFVLVAGVVVLIARVGDAPGEDGPSAPGSMDPSGPGPSGEGTTRPDPDDELDDEQALGILSDVDRSAGLRPGQIRTAAAQLLAGPWADHVDASWQDRVTEWLPTAPVVVGAVTIGDDARTVAADLTFVLDPVADEVVFRTLAASTVLGETAFQMTVSVDGVAVEPQVDRDGARATVLLPAIASDGEGDGETGGSRILRVTANYVVPEAGRIIDDGGPAGGGLLARSDGVTTLGHWLPVPTYDTGPMVSRGDVAAFDASVWSVRVQHPGVLVTGGIEAPCPQEPRCTQSIGIGLRDLSAVLFDAERETASTSVGELEVRGFAPPGRSAPEVTEEAARSAEILAHHLGALPWRQVDVVGVPLGHAGMEFPGIVWLQSSRWDVDRGFASYVNAHEIGHQWFHALVGNGSLSAPFLDESLAQYAAYLVFAELYGQERADALAAEQFEGRFNRAGRPADAVCLPLDGFSSANAYGAVVYGRGGQVWVDLERAHGRDGVTAMLRTWIEQVELSAGVMPETLVGAAAAAGNADIEEDVAALLLDDRC